MRWLGLVLLTWWSLTGCQPAAQRTITGVLVDVQAREIVNADAISLRDQADNVWTFRVNPSVASNPDEPFSASHLRQHLMLAQPVEVSYREADGSLEAIRIRDAVQTATPSVRG